MVLRWAFLTTTACAAVNEPAPAPASLGSESPVQRIGSDRRRLGSHRVATVTVLLHILTDPRSEQPARKLTWIEPLSDLIRAPPDVWEGETKRAEDKRCRTSAYRSRPVFGSRPCPCCGRAFIRAPGFPPESRRYGKPSRRTAPSCAFMAVNVRPGNRRGSQRRSGSTTCTRTGSYKSSQDLWVASAARHEDPALPQGRTALAGMLSRNARDCGCQSRAQPCDGSIKPWPAYSVRRDSRVWRGTDEFSVHSAGHTFEGIKTSCGFKPAALHRTRDPERKVDRRHRVQGDLVPRRLTTQNASDCDPVDGSEMETRQRRVDASFDS